MRDSGGSFAGPGIQASTDWKLFLGLSRTPHGLLDMATPAMAALLWLGHFPPVSTTIIGIITAFAGYTAVYALNDIVDYKIDAERIGAEEAGPHFFDVDAMMARHPIAQGLLPLKNALYWASFWAVVALVGAWILNPLCAILFVFSALFEIIYCKLLKITHLKIIPSAIVKASGGLAGVYAVDPSPSTAFVVLLVIWLSTWEVGGQNIANDFVDMEGDAGVSAKTTLTIKGVQESVFIMIAAISVAVTAGVASYWLAGARLSLLYPFGAVILGWKLLLEPAREVFRDPNSATAASLFNLASYMPAAFLALVIVSILTRS